MDNPYCYPGTNTLINKLGIVDATELKAADEFLTSKRMAQIDETPISGDLDYKHLTEIHKHIFSDLYDWAVKQREWQTERASGRFQWPDNIEKEANKLLAALKNENHLKGLDRNNFIIRAAHYFGELNHIHPYPEGNGRSQRTFFDDLGRKAGYKFEWSADKKGRDEFLEAVVHSHARDESKLELHFINIVSFINKPSIGIAEKEAEYKAVKDAQAVVKD